MVSSGTTTLTGILAHRRSREKIEKSTWTIHDV
jgi:hypothetical protein